MAYDSDWISYKPEWRDSMELSEIWKSLKMIESEIPNIVRNLNMPLFNIPLWINSIFWFEFIIIITIISAVNCPLLDIDLPHRREDLPIIVTFCKQVGNRSYAFGDVLRGTLLPILWPLSCLSRLLRHPLEERGGPFNAGTTRQYTMLCSRHRKFNAASSLLSLNSAHLYLSFWIPYLNRVVRMWKCLSRDVFLSLILGPSSVMLKSLKIISSYTILSH